MLDRSWAKGLDQKQFDYEYLQRVPFADVIPDVNLWAEGHEPVYAGIEPINPEDYEADNVPTVEKAEKPKVYNCRGCGKDFSISIARAGHERHCKQIVKKGA